MSWAARIVAPDSLSHVACVCRSTCQEIGRNPNFTHVGRRTRLARFFGPIGVLVLLVNTRTAASIWAQRCLRASKAARTGSLIGTSRTLLRVFGVPKPASSEYVSFTCTTPRRKSTRPQRSAAISPMRSPVSTATITTVRHGSGKASTSRSASGGSRKAGSFFGTRSPMLSPRAGFSSAYLHVTAWPKTLLSVVRIPWSVEEE